MGDPNAMEIDPPNKTQLRDPIQMFGHMYAYYEDLSSAVNEHTKLLPTFLKLFRSSPAHVKLIESSYRLSPQQLQFPGERRRTNQIVPTHVGWL